MGVAFVTRGTPRQIERRERILQAVRDQLETNGYDGMNMRELAESAGVSPTTLYNLYESKDVLILSALRDLLEQLRAQSEAVERGTPDPGIPHYLARQDRVAQQIIETPRYAEAMTRMLFNAEPANAITQVLLTDAIALTVPEVEQMVALRQLVRDTDVERLSRDLVGNRWALLLMWMKGFVALQQLRTEHARCNVLTLWPSMTPAWQSKLDKQLKKGAHPLERVASI